MYFQLFAKYNHLIFRDLYLYFYLYLTSKLRYIKSLEILFFKYFIVCKAFKFIISKKILKIYISIMYNKILEKREYAIHNLIYNFFENKKFIAILPVEIPIYHKRINKLLDMNHV